MNHHAQEALRISPETVFLLPLKGCHRRSLGLLVQFRLPGRCLRLELLVPFPLAQLALRGGLPFGNDRLLFRLDDLVVLLNAGRARLPVIFIHAVLQRNACRLAGRGGMGGLPFGLHQRRQTVRRRRRPGGRGGDVRSRCGFLSRLCGGRHHAGPCRGSPLGFCPGHDLVQHAEGPVQVSVKIFRAENQLKVRSHRDDQRPAFRYFPLLVPLGGLKDGLFDVGCNRRGGPAGRLGGRGRPSRHQPG